MRSMRVSSVAFILLICASPRTFPHESNLTDHWMFACHLSNQEGREEEKKHDHVQRVIRLE